MSTRWPNLALLLFVLIGVSICLYVIATRQLNATDALLVSLMLTILSMLGSWVASRYYSEISFNNNLKIFALKAAEKVNNLSNQLDRLSSFLQEEVQTEDYSSPTEALLARDARLEAAIHIINTLKSVNDTSLSDWRGVIGEELNAQKEEREEQEEDLRELIERVEALSLQIGDSTSLRDNTTAALASEVGSIKSDLQLLTSRVVGVPVRRPKNTRQSLEMLCPHCSASIKYQQKVKEGSYKSFNCQMCNSKLLSIYKEGGFSLELNEPLVEKTTCPSCGSYVTYSLRRTPGNISETTCPSCSTSLRISRTRDGVRIKIPGVSLPSVSQIGVDITEELINQVREMMPPQPWPSGASREVAEKLGVSNILVGKAISELVNRGVFKLQVDGKLYLKDEEKG